MQADWIGDQAAEGVEACSIVAPRYPQFQIAAITVLLGKMVFSTGDLFLRPELGVMRPAELYGPAYYRLTVYYTVGLGNKFAVYGARFAPARSTVVLGGLGDSLYLYGVEPFPHLK